MLTCSARKSSKKPLAATARDLMTSPAVTVPPDATIVSAVRLMDRHRIKQLVVVSAGGRLAGIVTTHDLLRVYLRSADGMRAEIIGEVLPSCPGVNPALVEVTVADGILTLDGQVEKKSVIPLAVHMARAVDGVVDVVDRLRFEIDDTQEPTAADLAGYRKSLQAGQGQPVTRRRRQASRQPPAPGRRRVQQDGGSRPRAGRGAGSRRAPPCLPALADGGNRAGA